LESAGDAGYEWCHRLSLDRRRANGGGGGEVYNASLLSLPTRQTL